MNNKYKPGFTLNGIFKTCFFSLVLAMLFSACKQKDQTANSAKTKSYYTCSMHPQVHEDHPGNCPICHMVLIKVELTSGNSQDTKNKIRLTASQIKLAGIETDTIDFRSVGSEKTLTGTVAADQSQSDELSARVAGRIVHLYIKTPGENVAAGQPVYDVYSEDLAGAEKEYLLALQQKKELNNPDVDYNKLTSAAENKLQLWGFSPAQVKRLAASGKVSSSVTVLSKTSGIVTEINVHEGDYITEGMNILKTDNLNSLWVEAQIYANETSLYHIGDQVTVSFPDLGGKQLKSKIAFINPDLSAASKLDLIRVSIPNSQGIIRPGMLAYVSLISGQQKALAVPASALNIGGRGIMVWVKNTDGSFSPRMVSLGTGNQVYAPVLSGLSKGEIVVSNGTYLLNSEYIFKNGDDKGGMGGMKM
ncbi:MAG TPA: efflux RND transporter periplasmic adaptor subunit [Mucilaginibacter sp.]|nr:efflux RND transporter periplasmic adaptor subunit [Mucilaginibacter sp.]